MHPTTRMIYGAGDSIKIWKFPTWTSSLTPAFLHRNKQNDDNSTGASSKPVVGTSHVRRANSVWSRQWQTWRLVTNGVDREAFTAIPKQKLTTRFRAPPSARLVTRRRTACIYRIYILIPGSFCGDWFCEDRHHECRVIGVTLYFLDNQSLPSLLTSACIPILSTGLVQHALESHFKFKQRERKFIIASVTQIRFLVLIIVQVSLLLSCQQVSVIPQTSLVPCVSFKVWRYFLTLLYVQQPQKNYVGWRRQWKHKRPQQMSDKIDTRRSGRKRRCLQSGQNDYFSNDIRVG